MHTVGDKASDRINAPGNLAPPRRAGVGWTRFNDPARQVQVSPRAHGTDRRDRRTVAKTDRQKEPLMRIVVSSVFVDDQDKALDFYTNKLGFVKKMEIPMGAARW